MKRSAKGSGNSFLLHILAIIFLYLAVIFMLSTLQSSVRTQDTGNVLVVKSPGEDLRARHLIRSPDPSLLTTRNLLTDLSNTGRCSCYTTSVDDLRVLPCSRLKICFGRVVVVGRHDTDAWTQERKADNTELHAAAVSSSLDSNGTDPGDYFPVDAARSSFALTELQTENPRTVDHCPNTSRLPGGTAVLPHDWTSPASPVRPSVTIGPCSLEGLSEGRRLVGKTLVRCGIINISGMSSIVSTATGCCRDSCACPVDVPAVSTVTPGLRFGETDGRFIAALADWTSEWVHTLVIHPYLQGNFRFQYQGKSSKAPASVALRIRRALSVVQNPVQVAIHALWSIGALTKHYAHDNAHFLSVPIFRYLHNNGTFVVEDFMYRTFVACAMISDKTVNDATLSTSAWNRMTHIPQVILNATERYVLGCLGWNAVMTRIQWQDTIVRLRSCIKMSSVFDPFAYDRSSSSRMMARCLDELINLSYAEETRTCQQGQAAREVLAPQPIRRFARQDFFDATEWCPRDDPVINQKPRTIGIAPGASRNSGTLRVGTTAKEILDSILGSRNVNDLAHLARPIGTSFCASFGVIGARLAHTIKTAGACQSASWVHPHD